MPGEELTRWTVRAALVFYFAVLLGRAARRPAGSGSIARGLWTAGCLLLWAHVVCALGFDHGWSLQRAYEHVATRTQEQVGIDSGAGLYVNFLFAAVWAADCAWWWYRPKSYADRPAALRWSLHAFMLFIVVNATVVFETGTVRWAGAAALLLLVLAWLAGRRAPPRTT